MKIVFMGTPAFAVPPLEVLASSGHEVGYVFTQPDKAKDRGKKIHFSPVKEKALELGIPTVQPEKIKGNQEIFDLLKEYQPDLIVVAAYGQILPRNVLEIPRLGCLNLHGSLLPKYRGAAPIQRAIMEGEEMTGITLMQMGEGLDTGDMLAKVEIPVDAKTFSDLHDELSRLGARLLKDRLPEIENQTLIPIKQEDEKATYAHMVFKRDGHVDFTKSPVEIERLVRGLAPTPGTYALYKGEPMKIFKVQPLDEKNERDPGTITGISKAGIEVSAGGETLLITEIQMPNKKRMRVTDFLVGNKMELFAKLN